MIFDLIVAVGLVDVSVTCCVVLVVLLRFLFDWFGFQLWV